MNISPLKYPKLNKFQITITSIADGEIQFTFNENPSFRTYIGKKIYFIFGGVIYYGIYRYKNSGSNKLHCIYDIPDYSSLISVLNINDVCDVYDTFNISEDNEGVTYQDIIDYFQANGGGFSLNSDNIVYAIYDNKSKSGLISPFEKSKLDSISITLKRNPNPSFVGNTYFTIGYFKIDQYQTEYKLFLRDTVTNEILDARLQFSTDFGCLFKVNHCNIDETNNLEFRLSKVTYDSGSYARVEIKTLIDISTFELFLGIPKIDSMILPSTSVLSTTSITFNDGDISFIVNKYLADIDSITKRTFLTDAEKQILSEPPTFDSDIVVNLSNGKTLGRYISGDTIPSTGKTPEEVLNLIAQEPIAPEVTLTSATVIEFNQTAISNVLNFDFVLKSLGAVVQSVSLEYRRGSSGGWTVLSTDTAIKTFTHNLIDTNFNTTPFNYRYIVTDNKGASATAIKTLTPKAYVAPTVSLLVTASSLGVIDTNLKRETGNVSSKLNGSTSRNSPLVNILSYRFSLSLVNGVFNDIDASVASPASNGGNFVEYVDATPTSANAFATYRVTITDEYTTTTALVTVNFRNLIFFGPTSAAPADSAAVRALANKRFSDDANTFILNTGTVEKIFALAIPTTKNLSSIIDLDALNVVITSSYILNNFNVNDANNFATAYKVYIMSNAVPYGSSHRHQVTLS